MHGHIQQPDTTKFRVVIVGGGPGGLFAARHLEAKAGDACQITVLEASERIGGKIVTRQFAGVGVYEAGVAEIYDYSRLGPDPLHDLIVDELGLDIKYLRGGPCILDDKIILTVDDLAQHFGNRAFDEVTAFHRLCAELLSPESYYLSLQGADNAHPWAAVKGCELLQRQFTNISAQRYIRTMVHSDIAAPMHQTTGLTLLKNIVMDFDGYMDILSIKGGNEQIVHGIAKRLRADVRLNSYVRAVEPLQDGTYLVHVDASGVRQTITADFVVLAVPLSALSTIKWLSLPLQSAIDNHVGYFDRPAHYLRATLLFKRQFWRGRLPADWFMLDAFDGCCVYDESTRNDLGGCGILAFLIAGNAALALANLSDDQIEAMCLKALPPFFSEALDLIIDRRIHRWMASVNAVPGGIPVRRRAINHQPAPRNMPGIIMVGDYMFDATLNGVMDSADTAGDIILANILARRHAFEMIPTTVRADWSAAMAKEKAIELLMQPEALLEALLDMLGMAYGLTKQSKILHFGSGRGQIVASLRSRGYDVIGIEWNRVAHSTTPAEIQEFNRLGGPTDLPFDDNTFEVVVETGLWCLPDQFIQNAINEVRRITKRGMFLGSVVIDLQIEIIERYGLLDGAQTTLDSRWEWAERLFASGFFHALVDLPLLDKLWKRATEAGASYGHWCESPEDLLFCFYELRNIEPRICESDVDLISARGSKAVNSDPPIGLRANETVQLCRT
jgi:monoamine oxidase/ubiquinone/menaquinone biosynthesis C-methylase UbiE